MLLANGAEVNVKDNANETSLYYAVEMGHKDVAELLVQHGGQERLNGNHKATLATNQPASLSKQESIGIVLSADQASILAATLANDECERLYKKLPFRPEQYKAKMVDGLYHWGQLDVGAPAGLSAEVSFKPDGSDPKVKVWFSSDIMQH